MKMIHRRLARLEGRFGPFVETAETKRLRERIAVGRLRVAQHYGDGERVWVDPVVSSEGGLDVVDVLTAGRLRAFTDVTLTDQ